MRTPVLSKDLVVEVFDAQAEPRDAQLSQGLHLGLGKRPRLAFEGHLLGLIPANVGLQPPDERLELLDAQVRRRAAAEVDEAKRAAAQGRQLADQLDLAGQRRDVGLDVAGLVVGEHLEVAEFAAFATERNMQIKPQRRLRSAAPPTPCEAREDAPDATANRGGSWR